MRHPLALVLASTLLAACSSTQNVSSSVALGPHGRAEGLLRIPANSETHMKLQAQGPGPAWFVVRGSDGASMSEGSLGTSKTVVTSSDPEELTIVLEAGAEEPTNVGWAVRSQDGIAIEWDLSRAQPAER